MNKLTDYTDEELVTLAQKIIAKYNKALADAKEIAMEYGFENNEQEINNLNIVFAKLKEKRDAVTKEDVEPAFKAALESLFKVGDFTSMTELLTLFNAQNYKDVKRKLQSMNMFREKRKTGKDGVEREPRAAAMKLRVTLPDGRVICHQQATQTLMDVVEYAGFDRVESLNWSASKQPFVSRKRCPRYQHERDGWYVTIHSDTLVKKQQIEKLSDIFQLGLVVEIV